MRNLLKRIMATPGSNRAKRSSSPKRPIRGYHHGNLRRALLDAAAKILEANDAGELGLRAVARMAGVSQAAPYRHFADKQALLAAVAEEGFRTMSEAMRHAAASARDPAERLLGLGVGYVEFATAHRAHFRVMFGRELIDKSQFPDLAKAASEAFSVLYDTILECQRAGVTRRDDPAEQAFAAWSIVHGLANLIVNEQLSLAGKSPATLALDITRNLIDGMRPR
ncbi:MAG TPA: TetR/AcrR family transcriptional regulator [Candidatus Binataceae bacterium]|nr:TetR/AcrR family transcriptional regulator [Candidatus Binataceae bacterium]